jgi:hypothetical protein
MILLSSSNLLMIPFLTKYRYRSSSSTAPSPTPKKLKFYSLTRNITWIAWGSFSTPMRDGPVLPAFTTLYWNCFHTLHRQKSTIQHCLWSCFRFCFTLLNSLIILLMGLTCIAVNIKIECSASATCFRDFLLLKGCATSSNSSTGNQ